MLDLMTLKEPDVVNIIEEHFKSRGFDVAREVLHDDIVDTSRRRYLDSIDLNCTHAALQQRWIVESKGSVKNSENRANKFQVGLTQLIYRMRPPEQFPDQMVFYALAFPGNPSLEKRCRRVPPWPRQLLQLHWLLIQADQSVKLLCPPGCACQRAWMTANLPTDYIEENEYFWQQPTV